MSAVTLIFIAAGALLALIIALPEISALLKRALQRLMGSWGQERAMRTPPLSR